MAIIAAMRFLEMMIAHFVGILGIALNLMPMHIIATKGMVCAIYATLIIVYIMVVL